MNMEVLPGTWLKAQREKSTGLAIGLSYQAHRGPREIDFKAVCWASPKVYYEILVSENISTYWDPHSVLSNWEVIRAVKPSRKNPLWLTLGRRMSFGEGEEAQVAEIRGSWVLLERAHRGEEDSRYVSFLGIFKATELLEYFNPRLTRLERAAFL